MRSRIRFNAMTLSAVAKISRRAIATEWREIAENWADRGYITAKDLLKLEKAGMRDVAKISPKWAPSKRELKAEASPKKETIGIMLGSLEGDLITVSDAVPGEAKSSTHACEQRA